jgi:shikimate 5-dehydrogenase
MKIALLGAGFGQAHAAVYAQRPDVNEVVVFGRTPQKLATISDQFGFATAGLVPVSSAGASGGGQGVRAIAPAAWPPFAWASARAASVRR